MTEFLTQDQRDLEGVAAIPWTAAGGTLTRDTVAPIDGAKSLKLTSTVNGLAYALPGSGAFTGVVGGRRYWAHTRFKGPANRAMQLWVRRYHPGLGTYTDVVYPFTSTGEVQQVSGSIISVVDTAAIGYFILDFASTIGSVYWFDSASLTDVAPSPDIIVEVAFSDGPLVENPTWTDISEWCYAANINRGKGRITEQFKAGTAAIQVDNSDRRFDPSNAASPYYPNVKPNKQVRIRTRFPSTTGTVYPRYRGLIDSWPIAWHKDLGEATITATDKTKFWEQFPLEGDPYSLSILEDAPIGYWKMDETNQEQQAVDASGNARHGYYYGAPHFELPDPITDGGMTAVDFGTYRTGQLGVLGIGELDIGTAAYAVELWFRSEEMQGSAVETGKFLWSIHDGTFFSTAIFLDAFEPVASGTSPSGGLLRFYCPGLYLDSPTALDDGAWHHVVGQRLSGGDAELYVDGVLVDTAAPGSTAIAANQAWIGGIAGVGANGGLMDHVSIYDDALFAARVLAHYEDRSSWEDDTTGERINRILDIVGEPAGMRDIDTGQSSLQGESQLEGSALAHMHQVARSEFGSLYVDRSGKARFRERHAMYFSPYTVSQATFTDAVGDDLILMRYSSPEFDFDEATIRNSITKKRRDGAPQTLKDAASITTYGERSHSESDLLNRNDNEVRSLVWLERERHAEPFLELPQITLTPSVDPNLWVTVLNMELEDRVTVVATPPGGGTAITKQMHVLGMQDRMTADPPNWTTVLNLATAEEPPADIWILGTSALGVDTALVA